jgi:aspartyl-tRNA(Asn)/glutamyl-tRNA(Gln) amidotransferase subunit A
MTDLHWLTLAEASTLIRDRKLSPVEYATALYERADKVNPRLDAFITQTHDIALAEARVAEAEIQAGDWRGPMHGIPYGLKDIIDVEGLKTTAHSKVLADNVAKADATVTRNLRDAGGVLMGKMSTHEFAIGGPSFDLPWPPARNPWNPDHHPGGSSSGSGAAVASGILPAALGSDTGGSVRNPASCCGIVGMKATYGRVSRAGVVPLSFSLDHVGPMTRTVEDNAILLNAIAGHDPADPGSARADCPDFTAGLKDGVRGMKIGVIRHFHARDMEADPEMVQAFDDAANLLGELGAELREIELAPLADYSGCNRVIIMSEAYAIHEKWLQERPQDYGELCRQRIMPGAFMRAADYVQALRVRTKLTRQFAETMDGLDAAISISSMEPPCRIEDPEEVERSYPRQARTVFNVIGNPAVAIPTGFSSNGIPLAMQVVGKAFDEAAVYRVSHAYEQAAGWTDRRPPLD